MRKFLFGALATILLFPALTHAQYLDQLTNTTTGTGTAAYDGDAPSESIFTTVGDIIGVLLSLLGIIFLILTIYSGFLWMTAQGDPKQVQKAKDILVQAVTGIIIVVTSYSISDFVISNIAA